MLQPIDTFLSDLFECGGFLSWYSWGGIKKRTCNNGLFRTILIKTQLHSKWATQFSPFAPENLKDLPK